MRQCDDTPRADLRRMLRPLNTLATWLLGIAGVLNVLHVFGYNVQPLLAAGGVSGIALGFGAQKITQNLLSGITMVRPALLATNSPRVLPWWSFFAFASRTVGRLDEVAYRVSHVRHHGPAMVRCHCLCHHQRIAQHSATCAAVSRSSVRRWLGGTDVLCCPACSSSRSPSWWESV